MAQVKCPNCGAPVKDVAVWKLAVIGLFGILVMLQGLSPMWKGEDPSIVLVLFGLGLLALAWWYSRPPQVFQCTACRHRWNRTGKPVGVLSPLQVEQSQQIDTQPRATSSQVINSKRPTSECLQEIDNLLADKIITEEEYRLKREEILREV